MKKRDKAILEDLNRFRCLSRDDIVDLHFSNLKYPIPTANNVLKRMRLQGHIRAVTDRQQFIYLPAESGMKNDSAKIPHFLKIVQFYRDVRKHDKPTIFNVEPKYGNKGTVEPDIFMLWKGAPFFVEIQRSVYSKKVFDAKMERYKQFFDSMIWENETWQPKDKKYFPYIWIITDTRYSVENKPFKVFQSRNVKEFLESLK
ncbi:replication-relaxation family protein [Anaerobacillus sp. MEB173]|uniref:replication-relaxation family protein n=1 Tax=Anaerobacillus sp. MEB173 TaxID=3383345 RepID=UPI003F92CD86